MAKKLSKSDNPATMQLLTEIQTAQVLGFSVSWLQKMRLAGSDNAPPHLKIGRAIRYDENELKQWVKSRNRAGR